jgi:hypothetical protein
MMLLCKNKAKGKTMVDWAYVQTST